MNNARNESLQRKITVKITTSKNDDDYNFKIFTASTAITSCASPTTWTQIENKTISLHSKFQISGSGIGDVCFFKDGTSSGGLFQIRQKNGNSDLVGSL